MKIGRNLQRISVLAFIAVFIFAALAFAASNIDSGKPRADVIKVAIGQADEREMPPALFEHDKHTEALAAKGQDCTVCHTQMDGSTPFVYKGIADDADFESQLDAFHASCIGCHMDMEYNEQATGPLDGQCRLCHVDANIDTQTLPVTMDKSLHAIHIESAFIKNPNDPSANCGVCHHSYDLAAKELVWVPGTEQACSVCHTDSAQGNTPSLKDAMHTSCVSCHANRSLEAQSKATAPANAPVPSTQNEASATPVTEAALMHANGPETCAGCHSLAGQEAFPVLKNPPRLMRGQPDATVLLPMTNAQLDEQGKAESKVPLGDAVYTGMNPVIFNHKAHEEATETCSVCHHVRIEDGSCSTCHTVEGRPEGQFVQLGKAMHDPFAEQSCVGCHQETIANKLECAGCHVAVKPKTETSCVTCHQPVQGISTADVADGTAFELSKEELETIALENIEARKPVTPLSPDEIPETVIIDALSDEYEPSVFQHRAIYKSLIEGAAASKLAETFHSSPLAACAACHHNSPMEGLANPPKCVTCHSVEPQATSRNVPSLKVAYHQQCMSCHTAMKLESPAATDCTACHAVRK